MRRLDPIFGVTRCDQDRHVEDGRWQSAVVLHSVDERDQWSVFHFSQSNGDGPGSGDVAALLRRVADSLDALGDVQVQDITFHSQVTDGEDDLSMTVYYDRSPRRR